MAKKKAAKKAAKKKVSSSAPREIERFFPDDEQTNPGRNRALAACASVDMLTSSILEVRRIEVGSRKGWLFICRS